MMPEGLLARFTALRASFLVIGLVAYAALGQYVSPCQALPAVLSLAPKPVNPLKPLTAMAFGALIGYCANRLAIWLLFNPAEPVRVWRFEFQGLIPKKRAVLASKVADVIASDILSEDEIERLLRGAGERAMEDAIQERLALLPVPPGLAGRLTSPLCSIATAAAKGLMVRAANAIDLKSFVVEKANSLDPRDFSRLFHKAIGKELRWISLNDAMLGALMGLVESVLFSLLAF